MQVCRSEKAVTAGVNRRVGRRAYDGREGPPVGRGRRVGEEPVGRAGVRVEAHGVDGGGGRRKPIKIRSENQKEERRLKRPARERKNQEQGLEKKTL